MNSKYYICVIVIFNLMIDFKIYLLDVLLLNKCDSLNVICIFIKQCK